MNVVHCNECGRTGEVYKVEVTAARMNQVAGQGTTMLGKAERKQAEGDLCATCLDVVLDSLSTETGYGLALASEEDLKSNIRDEGMAPSAP